MKKKPAPGKRASPERAPGKTPGNNTSGHSSRVTIHRIPTGVLGLDEVLHGGLPELSCSIIAGPPGSGKTTLAHQVAFANATVKKPALYFTVLGEPAMKMLRHQQQYTFFDPSKLGKAIRFINLTDVLLEYDLKGVLQEIVKQVTAVDPGIVVIDSFRTVVTGRTGEERGLELQLFIQRLAQFLTSWNATTFLVGEYDQEEIRENSLFTIVDGIFWLSQQVERNSVVRKLQVLKLRGQASVPGLHTVRIDDDGLRVFLRTMGFGTTKAVPSKDARRLSMGIPELDEMMGGGLHAGDSLLVAGPSGTGKSALATQFIAAGLRRGEPAIMAIFEERPEGYTARAETFGLDLESQQQEGRLEIIYLRPLDLSVDEITQTILDAVHRVGAKRLVIDSLVGFEMALAPGFREDFRESLYRMIVALTWAGVTVFTTVEVEDRFTALQLSHYTVSFLTDDIIRLRYVEIEGQLRKVIVVVKMRGGNHSKDIREYIITDKGVVLIKPRSTEYEGLITGIPRRTGPRPAQPDEAAPEQKAHR